MTTNYRGLVHHQFVHGHAAGEKVSPTYHSWASMVGRCKSAPRYVRNGITVCDRWLSFVPFVDDMGERPEGTSLERIDNNAGYYPGNCRWATPTEQARNRKSTRLNFEDARKIVLRFMAGESAIAISEDYEVAKSLILGIVRGKMWKDAQGQALSEWGDRPRVQLKRRSPWIWKGKVKRKLSIVKKRA